MRIKLKNLELEAKRSLEKYISSAFEKEKKIMEAKENGNFQTLFDLYCDKQSFCHY
jgi:hypothetical protein